MAIALKKVEKIGNRERKRIIILTWSIFPGLKTFTSMALYLHYA